MTYEVRVTPDGPSSQAVGRRYPYVGALEPSTGDLLTAIKQTLDPQPIMNLGTLRLG